MSFTVSSFLKHCSVRLQEDTLRLSSGTHSDGGNLSAESPADLVEQRLSMKVSEFSPVCFLLAEHLRACFRSKKLMITIKALKSMT